MSRFCRARPLPPPHLRRPRPHAQRRTQESKRTGRRGRGLTLRRFIRPAAGAGRARPCHGFASRREGGTFASGRGAIIQRGKQTVLVSGLLHGRTICLGFDAYYSRLSNRRNRLMKPREYSGSVRHAMVSDTQLVPTNWASSQPHLALLKRFLSAREAKDGVPDFWAPAFGMSPHARYRRNGCAWGAGACASA